MITFSNLKDITKGSVIQLYRETEIHSICIDSRKAGIAAGLLFFAIKGDRHDGHRHIEALYESGVRQFVVEHAVDISKMVEGNFLVVHSSITALQSLSSFHRQQFKIPVIGITGSNGKTIIKEWLFQMLSGDRIVVKNPASYNSQVGVPLAVWQMQPHHQIGIFEAGISRPGEMEKLEMVIRPTIGIFTNIGTAHDEGFVSRERKIAEKFFLFQHCELLIYNKDQREVDAAAIASGIKTFSWGEADGSDVRITNTPNGVSIATNKTIGHLTIIFEDNASRENLLHCVALMLCLGYELQWIQERLDTLRAVPMRMELKEGINYCQIIDDTYNNDLGGLEIALQVLENQNQKKGKRLILSDVLESGLSGVELTTKIVAIIQRYRLNAFIGIGPILKQHKALFTLPALFYETTQEFLDNFDFEQLQDESILVKGARRFSFERIVSRLQRKVHGTVMEIDLDALVDNYNFFKSRLLPSTKMMVMVKAFAYGSGSVEIANLLQYHQADYLGVAYADEGIELRKHNIRLPIMVMNPSEESFESLLAYALEPEIYSLRIFKSLLTFLKGNSCTVHIKIDTGMHRLGFEPDQLDALISMLKENPAIQVASIFSHLAGADEHDHDDFSEKQYHTFMSAAMLIADAVGYKPLYHILNTPGILRLPQFQLDMVRLGIGLYGVDPTAEDFEALRPVATLKTIISQIKHVRRGETIGYGRRGLAEKDISIATIAIGYADGFSRAFSRGVGRVLINGAVARVVGNVCMDMTMVDITGIKAAEGDEVILFGKDFPIRDMADRIKSIPYEILTSTSERVKRVFIADGI